eukprot:15333907-Ditylum_brightwellii.AAC.1
MCSKTPAVDNVRNSNGGTDDTYSNGCISNIEKKRLEARIVSFDRELKTVNISAQTKYNND